MATNRDELRENLVGVIEAAPELRKEDREHLADVFLDRLTSAYDLVPRGTTRMPQSNEPPGRQAWRGRWVPIILVLAFLLFVVPAMIHHFVLFLLALVVVFFFVKHGGPGMWRHRSMRW